MGLANTAAAAMEESVTSGWLLKKHLAVQGQEHAKWGNWANDVGTIVDTTQVHWVVLRKLGITGSFTDLVTMSLEFLFDLVYQDFWFYSPGSISPLHPLNDLLIVYVL